jgi:hypothetical protein
MDAVADSRHTSASRTRAGPRTACRASATRTRISPTTASRSSTTASSRTTRAARELKRLGYEFTSETDTEVHRAPHPPSPAEAGRPVQGRARHGRRARRRLRARRDQRGGSRSHRARAHGLPGGGRPGVGENFVASDVSALLPVTRRFMFLEEGDVAEIRRDGVRVIDATGNRSTRAVRESELSADAAEKGQYRHFMLKEIHEQPRAVAHTLQERVANGRLLEAAFGRRRATAIFKRTEPCTSSPAAPATMPDPWRATDRADLPLPATSRSPANTAIATRWCRRTRCS